jgi:hypothetical protein
MTGAILEEGGLVGLKAEKKVACQKGEALFQKGMRRGRARGEGTELSRRGSCSSLSGGKLVVMLKKRV